MPSPLPDLDAPDFHAALHADQPEEDLPPHREVHPLVSLQLDDLVQVVTLEKHVRDLSFVMALRHASLDDGIGLVGDAVEQLHHPPTKLLRIENPDIELAFKNFLALEHSSEQTYNKIREAIHQ